MSASKHIVDVVDTGVQALVYQFNEAFTETLPLM